MELSHLHNPFITQPNRTGLSSVDSKGLLVVSQKVKVRAERINQNDAKEASFNNRRQLFTLNPEQNNQISRLQNNNTSGSRVNNSSISQYLQTENIPQRNELESLLQLDIFV